MSYWWDELLNSNSTSLSFLPSKSNHWTATYIHFLWTRHTHMRARIGFAIFILMSTMVSLSIWRVEILVKRVIRREKKRPRWIIFVIVALDERFSSSSKCHPQICIQKRRRKKRACHHFVVVFTYNDEFYGFETSIIFSVLI